MLGAYLDPYTPKMDLSPADAVSVREKLGSTSVSVLSAVGIFVVVSMAMGMVGMFSFAGFKAGMPGLSPAGTDGCHCAGEDEPQILEPRRRRVRQGRRRVGARG